MHFQIEVEREEDGRWIAEVTDLPGVMAYGDDRASAVARAQALAMRVLARRTSHDEPDTHQRKHDETGTTRHLDRLYATEPSALNAELRRAQRDSLNSEEW